MVRPRPPWVQLQRCALLAGRRMVVVVVAAAAAAAAAVEVGSKVAVMASRTVLAGHFPPPLCARHGPSPGERRRGGSGA